MARSFLEKLFARLSPRCARNAAFETYLAFYGKGAYRDAYAALRDIMRDYPHVCKVGDTYVMCVNLELILNDDISKAGELLNTALRLGCRDMAAYYRASGYVFDRAGDTEAGIRDLEKAVALEPSVTNLAILGGLLSCAGDERAADICKQVLQQEPEHCRAHIYCGMLAAKTGNNGKALLLAKRAEELHPTVHELQEIGRLYGEAGETRAALDKYLQADRCEAEPKGPVYARIAACHFELGNVHEGRTYLELARRCNPESATVKEIWETYKERYIQG